MREFRSVFCFKKCSSTRTVLLSFFGPFGWSSRGDGGVLLVSFSKGEKKEERKKREQKKKKKEKTSASPKFRSRLFFNRRLHLLDTTLSQLPPNAPSSIIDINVSLSSKREWRKHKLARSEGDSQMTRNNSFAFRPLISTNLLLPLPPRPFHPFRAKKTLVPLRIELRFHDFSA